jgi:hypothetical protein
MSLYKAYHQLRDLTEYQNGYLVQFVRPQSVLSVDCPVGISDS